MFRLDIKGFASRDRGSIAMLDVVVGMFIVGILTAALMGIITSAYATSSQVQNRAELTEQIADLGDQLRSSLLGAAPSSRCLNRKVPTATFSVGNCLHLSENLPVVVSGTSSSICVLNGDPLGIDTVTGSPTDPIVLAPPDKVCVLIDGDGVLVSTRTPADNATNYVNATWTGDVVRTDLISTVADDVTFTFFDANSVEITTDASGLTEVQRPLVRRVVFSCTLYSSDAGRRSSESVVFELLVGSGQFAQERQWRGR
jgi:type II secretory pathway pseudopilin PulG